MFTLQGVIQPTQDEIYHVLCISHDGISSARAVDIFESMHDILFVIELDITVMRPSTQKIEWCLTRSTRKEASGRRANYWHLKDNRRHPFQSQQVKTLSVLATFIFTWSMQEARKYPGGSTDKFRPFGIKIIYQSFALDHSSPPRFKGPCVYGLVCSRSVTVA